MAIALLCLRLLGGAVSESGRLRHSERGPRTGRSLPEGVRVAYPHPFSVGDAGAVTLFVAAAAADRALSLLARA
jgi:hypothetical protein